MPLRVVLDSNFLFIPLQFHVDIFRELERAVNRKIEPVLLTPVHEELKKLTTKGVGNKKGGDMALRYAEKLKPIDVEVRPGETVDDIIRRIASEWKCPVATNDRELRKKLRDINVTVIYLRKMSHLVIEGNVM